MNTKPIGPLLLRAALLFAAIATVVVVAWTRTGAGGQRVKVALTSPEAFFTVLEEAETCDEPVDGVPTEMPGENGCVGAQPPVEPPEPYPPYDPGSTSTPSTQTPDQPTTGVPYADLTTTANDAVNMAGPNTMASPAATAQSSGTLLPPRESLMSASGMVTTWGWDRVPGAMIHKPAHNDPTSTSGAGGGELFDYQPNRAVQGLDVLDRLQNGSVSARTRRLTWSEIDLVAPGVTPETAFVIGRRYFSGLSDDGIGSTGARWISSLTERLEVRETEAGLRALHYVSWQQPYNDPDHWFVEQDPGSGLYTSGAVAGAIIEQDGQSYTLTFKNGNRHVFADSAQGIRVVQRADRWGNALDFAYTEPADPGGYRDDEVKAAAAAADGAALGVEDMVSGGSLVVTDSRGISYYVSFNGLGYITSVTDGLNQTWHYQYTYVGATGYLTRVERPAREVMEPDGTIVTRATDREYTYNAQGRLEDVIDDYGTIVLRNEYDAAAHDKIAKQTDANNAVYEFTEPSAGRVDVVNPNGFLRAYLKNADGDVAELRQYVANVRGKPGRSSDPNLYHAWYFERAHGCDCGVVTAITEPDGGRIELVYSADLDLEQVRKVGSDGLKTLTWLWEYDAQHRIEKFVPPAGTGSGNHDLHAITTTWQTVGGVTTRTTTIAPRDWRSNPSVWVDTIDSRGRLVERVGPPHDGTTPSFLGKWTYHTTGDGYLLPRQVYIRDATTVAYTLTWDRAGRITGISDDAGRPYTCQYDPEGRPRLWTAPPIHGGQVYSHDWLRDGNGRTRRMRWKYFEDDKVTAGTWAELTKDRDPMGQVLEQELQLDAATPQPTYAKRSWQYDLHGNVIEAVDPDGYVTHATYDERDLPWTLTDGVGTAEQTSKVQEYNPDGRVAAVVEQLDAGRQVRFVHEYDVLDRLHRYRIVDQQDQTKQAGYVEADYDVGSRIEEVRTYGITASGAAQLVDRKTFAYDDFVDGPTQQTSFVYDLATGAQLRTVMSRFEYGPSGLPNREFTGSTLIAQYEYFANGLPKKVHDLHGNAVALAYDQYGRCLTETRTHADPANGGALTTTRTFVRDQFGRATSVVDAGSGVASQTHTYVYDSNDLVVSRTAPDGGVSLFERRFDGQVVREDLEIAGSTVRAQQSLLTPAGRTAHLIDDRNQKVDFIYDGRGRLKQEVYPDSTSWTNEHNAGGLLTKIVAPSGRRIELGYDWRGMVTGRTIFDAQGNVLRADAYQIDLGGHVARVTKTENGVTQFVDLKRDSSGRVLVETTSIPGLPPSVVQFDYDGLGRLETLTSPMGNQRVYTYDDRNRVDTVSLHEAGTAYPAVDYDYLGAGSTVSRRTAGDGSVLTVLRDGHGRLTQMGTPNVATFDYGYDAGNRINRVFRVHAGEGDAHWYDKLGRLTHTTKDTVDPVAELASRGSTTHAHQLEYQLDGDSHRDKVVRTPMGQAPLTTDYTPHPSRHHYTAIQEPGQPVRNRAFDLDGRLRDDGSRHFDYDAVDNLVTVKDAGVTTATYVYDALDRRVMRSSGGWDWLYVNAGPWVVEEFLQNTAAGIPWTHKGTFVHGPGLDNLVMVRHPDWFDVDNDQDLGERQNLYVHQDHLGSTVALSGGPTGQVFERYEYDDYGAPTVLDGAGNVRAGGSAIWLQWLFTGREYDHATGLYHFRAREYDPGTGGFLQEDPLGLHDGVNLVHYAHANPLSLRDPYGTSGVGEMISDVLAFIDKHRGLIADILLDLAGPLEGLLDLISAATGKDITGWVRGGLRGSPESMGWWDRACAAAGAAIKIAAGGLRLLTKLKGIIDKLRKFVDAAMDALRRGGEAALCKLKSAVKGGKWCFVAGTMVVLGDGMTVPIEQVSEGDAVMCEVPAAAPGLEGLEEVRTILAVTGDRYRGALVTLVVVRHGQIHEITGTPSHPFWNAARHAWVPMGDLRPGDLLDGRNGPVEVVSRRVSFAATEVFNLSVDDARTYRVSELGVLVHNDCNPVSEAARNGRREIQIAQGHNVRVDTSTDGEGGFHVHVFDRKGNEVARVNGRGGYSDSHGGNPLSKPSDLPSDVRNDVNRVVRNWPR